MEYNFTFGGLMNNVWFHLPDDNRLWVKLDDHQASSKRTEPIATLHPDRPVALAICVWSQDTPDDFQEVWFQCDCPDRTTLREDLHGSGLVLAQPVAFPIAAGSRVRFWRRD